MFKKTLLLLLTITLIGCNASKPAIVTTQKKATNQKHKVAINTKKKPTYTKPSPNSKTEVIESTSKTVVTNNLIGDYISQYKEIAMGNMKNYGIPASIILAQGILESGAGRGDLALSSNNHFGIKCHKDWVGESVRHDDDSLQECFRKYKDPSESFRDHALFLTGKKRYAALFTYEKGDYKAWAKGLRAAGYATDPRYPEKLISYIERYELHQYDNQAMGKDYVVVEKTTTVVVPRTPNAANNINNLASYEVQKGDTLYSISKKFNVLVDDLKQKNNLVDNTLSIGQRLIVK
ncbi:MULTISPECIES: glucosaminidase domain-containing protein [unclassified Flavobacterium]|uniref:glucosaminidase domain-containing protein n=1 Tax=unclassified Flavobacterium TaxID=196869 RepID=UPI000F0C3A14|nr:MULTISPECIES: glucosaminidase domain-containing protein [unclassified Flavobacterium]AYN02843.1 LysM peptidoglycan-binding domain-containing protein [Flavobacterium sp. 140616W15]MCD0473061.1 glucosaminidase domain-containing protein [Flavobacterium sp. EDS]